MLDELNTAGLAFLGESWVYLAILGLCGVLAIWGKLAGKVGVRRKAEKVFEQADKKMRTKHRLEQVSLDEFPWSDREFYEATDAELTERHHYHYLADLENRTLTEMHPKMRTCIRTLAGPQGAIVAGIYHLVIRGFSGWLGKLLGQQVSHKIVDLETEFSDGNFVATTTASEEHSMEDPSGLLTRRLPPGTPLDELVAAHMERCREYLQANPGIRWTTVSTVEELLAFQGRLQALHQKHREAIGGGISDREFDVMAGDTPARTRDRYKEEFARIRGERASKTSPASAGSQPHQGSSGPSRVPSTAPPVPHPGGQDLSPLQKM